MKIEAPAKLNLSLRVLGKREDGFHELDTLMVGLPGLHDDLTIDESSEDSFSCNVGGLPTDASNLVIRARDLFRRETGNTDALAIHLEKRVPHGAGLGGGSSDAAATLTGLNKLLGGGLSDDRLSALAAEIGSDVPFFLKPSIARVKGRGEIIEVAEPIPSLAVLLLKPSFGVSTPDAYRGWAGAIPLPGINYGVQNCEGGSMINDLELPVFQKHPFLAEVKMWLLKQPGVSASLMSGSGSTMFAVLDELAQAEGIAETARTELDPTLWSWSGEIGGVTQG